MLKKFYVDNYMSLINVTFEPADLNLLLGLNNAGKTNLCQSLRFVSGLAFMNLNDCAESFAGGRFGMTNVYFNKSTIDFAVSADVPFGSERLTFHYELKLESIEQPTADRLLTVNAETLTLNGPGFDGVALIECTPERDRVLHEADHLQGTTRYTESVTSKDATMLSRIFDTAASPRAKQFRDYLCTWQYYALSPEAMRGSNHRPNDFVLTTMGENLSSVLYRLKTSDERRYRQLLRHLKRIDDSIDGLSFRNAADHVFMEFQDCRGNVFPAQYASAATLQYLALLQIFLAQPADTREQLIVVEQPENSLHVSMLRGLMELIENLPKPTQVVFTSHSPYFIDLFDDRLESVFLVTRRAGQSTVRELNAQVAGAYLEAFPLGEQNFREMMASVGA